MSGRLFIVGLGPGDAALQTPRATEILAEASDVLGYFPYVARVPERPGLTRHATDNREELNRARHALQLAAAGGMVALVSSGDPGVFAMASAVFEAIEAGEPAWRELEIEVVPGVSAMFASAARLGAPLGHDFCAISLSDNLKPWEVVLERLTATAQAGFVIALYNPISKARAWQLGAAFERLREVLPAETPVAFARAVSRPDERILTADLASARPQGADARAHSSPPVESRTGRGRAWHLRGPAPPLMSRRPTGAVGPSENSSRPRHHLDLDLFGRGHRSSDPRFSAAEAFGC